MTMEEALAELKGMHRDEFVKLSNEQEIAVDYAIAALEALMTIGADSAET